MSRNYNKQLSVYNDATKDSLNKKHKYYTKLFGKYFKKIIIDDIDMSITKMLKKIQKKNKKEILDIEIIKNDFFNFLKEITYRFLKDVSIMQYLVMEKNNDFGIHTDQRVGIGLTRCLMNVPNDVQVSQFDADRFIDLTSKFDKEHGRKTADDYDSESKIISLNLFGMEFPIFQLYKLENLLLKIDSPFNVFSFNDNNTPTFIMADLKTISHHNYTVYRLYHEYIRSPHKVLSVVASCYGTDSTILRHTSCEIIYFNKWQNFYNKPKFEFILTNEDHRSSIREGLKKKALSLGKIYSVRDAIRHKPKFIISMIDGIDAHEYGHTISNRDRSLLHGSITSSFNKSYEIVTCLEELIADWCIKKDKLMGAMCRFVERYHQGDKNVFRDFYVYLSDNWFVDGDDAEEYLPLLTDITTALAIQFIEDNGDINFEKIEKSIMAIYTYIQKTKSGIYEEIYQTLKEGTYEIENKKLSFKEISEYLFEMYRNNPNDFKKQKDMFYSYDFWRSLLGYADKYSKKTSKKLKDILTNSKSNVRMHILNMVSDGHPELYNNSLREYIYHKYEKIGILTKNDIRWEEAIEMVNKNLNLPDDEIEEVKIKFNEIIRGDEIDLFVSEIETEEDSFITVIQEMLIKTNIGNIFSPIISKREENLFNDEESLTIQLEGIIDQITGNKYDSINSIKHLIINSNFNPDNSIIENLNKIITNRGDRLLSIVDNIEHRCLDNDYLFLIIPAIQKGKIDWITMQAISRINLNSKDAGNIFGQWTIDKTILYILCKGMMENIK